MEQAPAPRGPNAAPLTGHGAFVTALPEGAPPPPAPAPVRNDPPAANAIRESYTQVLGDVSRLMEQPPEERLANLERFARCVTTRFRRRPASKEEMDLRCLMPESLSRSQEVWEYTSCAICLTDFADGEELRRACCAGGHAFHPKCLRGWLERSHTTCPVCRGGEDERERRAAARPTGPGSAEGLAEYVMRRMRSGKVDMTVSQANHKMAARVMRQLREPVAPLKEEPPELEETVPAALPAPEPVTSLPEILIARMEARKAERRPENLIEKLVR
mmetsp:Transcript_14889/g.33818  ORF Transcript_14889/g.33818 Transcript_14889/m.33818 type:complete len:274 (-) Transcript_14889:92-913(-)